MSMSKRTPPWLVELPVLALGLGVFLFLTFHQVDLPGLHTDEAMEVLPAVQLLRGQEIECYKDVCLDLFGLQLPVMIYEYIAAVNAYLAIPFFALFGINVSALRAVPIVQSVVAIVFFYLLARELYGRRVAMVACLLLAVNPSFVFWSRQGVFVTSVTIPISLAGAWALLRWWRAGRTRHLCLGALLFGLGMSAKLLFWWIIAGIGAAFILLNLDRVADCLRTRSLSPLHIRLRWRDVAIAGLSFLMGLFPLIFFNIKTQSTINYIRSNVFSSSYYDVDNAKVGENLRERIKELRSVVNGETFFYLGGVPYASWRYPSVFLLAVGVTAFSVLAPLSESGSSKHQVMEQTLPTWVTIAGVLVPGYVLLRFLGPDDGLWCRWTLALSLPAAALTIALFGRHRGWRIWAGHWLAGLSTSLLFIVFVYLSRKMAQWQSHKIYVSGILALLLAPLLRARGEIRRVLFPLLTLSVALVSSCFTPTGLLFTHLAILVPWPILVVAVAADLVARRLGLDRISLRELPPLHDRKWPAVVSLGLVAVLLPVGVLIYDDLEVDIAYHRSLAETGGIGDHTSASYALAQYLQEQQITDVVAMDWGIQDVIQFLSRGEINPSQLSSYEDPQSEDAAFAIRVQESLGNPDTLYVFRTHPAFPNRWDAFKQIARDQGLTTIERKYIQDLPGNPTYRLVRMLP